ncbi:MAG: hypothetical protein D6785_04530 [Planctomycetota bacterium]|nr:MAG: hypothetical protein D6785_04530 [Planctomycetota bacterium]
MVRIHTEIYTENLEGHLVIYGWQKHYKILLKELHGEGLSGFSKTIIVIQTDSHAKMEDLGSHIYSLPGSGDFEEDLRSANIQKAETLIISSFAKSSRQERAWEAHAILISLLAKKLNPRVRVVVDIPFGNNVEHLLNAGVDEVICGEEFCSMLAASTMINPGITFFFREILSTQYGNEFYCAPFVTSQYIGKTYMVALEEIKEDKNALLLGIMRRKNILVNPQFLTIEKGDMAILLCEKRPSQL